VRKAARELLIQVLTFLICDALSLQDPTLPALELLKVWCNPDNRYGPYLASLPQFGGADLTTTDFFTDAELDMLQWPPLVEETRKRKKVRHPAYTNLLLLRWTCRPRHTRAICLHYL
jgi:hypothetical protein